MIVDTSAIVAILKGEPGHLALMKTIVADPDPKISAATLVEVHAVADQRGQPAQSRRVNNLLRVLRIRVVPFDEDQARVASEAYAIFGEGSGHPSKLNLGDCFSYALAACLLEPLLFVGDDFSHTDIQLAE